MSSKEKILKWDGSYELKGSCNKYGASKGNDAVVSSSNVLDVSRIVSNDDDSISVSIDKVENISVSILFVGSDLVPFKDAACIRIKIGNFDIVKSLLLRIYYKYDKENEKDVIPGKDKLIYQEVLNPGEIKDLPDALEDDTGKNVISPTDAGKLREKYGYGRGFAHPLDSPYKCVIWISSDPNSFEDISEDSGNDPSLNKYTCVSDQTEKNDESKKGKTKLEWTKSDSPGTNLINYKLPKVCVLMFTPNTSKISFLGHAVFLEYRSDPKLGEKIRKNAKDFWIKNKDYSYENFDYEGYHKKTEDGERNFKLSFEPEVRTEFLFKRLDEALSLITNDGDDIMKIFVGPEWFFKSDSPYTRDDVGLIMSRITQLSSADKYKNVLIIPGSIIWRLNGLIADKIPIFNTLTAVKHGKILQIYHKQTEGSDEQSGELFIMDPKTARGSVEQSFLDNLKEGMLTKIFKGKCDTLNFEDEYVEGENKGMFYCENICFGMEICADHGSGKMKEAYSKLFPEGRGLDIYLYCACGAPNPNAGHIVSREGGMVIACDGSKSQLDHQKTTASWVYDVTKFEGKISDGKKPEITRRKIDTDARFNNDGFIADPSKKMNVSYVSKSLFVYKNFFDMNKS